jgi:hypothetical protein
MLRVATVNLLVFTLQGSICHESCNALGDGSCEASGTTESRDSLVHAHAVLSRRWSWWRATFSPGGWVGISPLESARNTNAQGA